MTETSSEQKQKIEAIITFINTHQEDFTRCADAHKAFMAENGKVSYVHFNRKFRELLPHLKPVKKQRTLRPIVEAPAPPPKNRDLKEKKSTINAYYRMLRDSDESLQKAIDENNQEMIDHYRDIRDRDRRAIIDCYDDLILYYEGKFPEDIIEINNQLAIEHEQQLVENEKILRSPGNILIGESDEDDEQTIEEEVSSTLKTAAKIVKPLTSDDEEEEKEPSVEVIANSSVDSAIETDFASDMQS